MRPKNTLHKCLVVQYWKVTLYLVVKICLKIPSYIFLYDLTCFYKCIRFCSFYFSHHCKSYFFKSFRMPRLLGFLKTRAITGVLAGSWSMQNRLSCSAIPSC